MSIFFAAALQLRRMHNCLCQMLSDVSRKFKPYSLGSIHGPIHACTYMPIRIQHTDAHIFKNISYNIQLGHG